MSNRDLKLNIQELVEEVEDTDALESVRYILMRFLPSYKRQNILAYSVTGEPLTIEKMEQELDLAAAAVKGGNYTPHIDFLKEVESW